MGAKIGVDFSTSIQLFKLLDLDGSKSITITEFISGIMQLRRSAKMVDVETLLKTTKKMMTTSVTHMKGSELRLQESLNILTFQQSSLDSSLQALNEKFSAFSALLTELGGQDKVPCTPPAAP